MHALQLSGCTPRGLSHHSDRKEDLANGVVDLVGPSVVEVLALEVDERAGAIGASVVLGQALWRRRDGLVSVRRGKLCAQSSSSAGSMQCTTGGGGHCIRERSRVVVSGSAS